MQEFDYTIKYKPGSENIAHALSRLICRHHQLGRRIEEYVRFVAQTATPKAMTTREVEERSHQDKELYDVRQCIHVGDWNNKETVQYGPVRGEL